MSSFRDEVDAVILNIGWKQIQQGAAMYEEAELSPSSLVAAELRDQKMIREVPRGKDRWP